MLLSGVTQSAYLFRFDKGSRTALLRCVAFALYLLSYTSTFGLPFTEPVSIIYKDLLSVLFTAFPHSVLPTSIRFHSIASFTPLHKALTARLSATYSTPARVSIPCLRTVCCYYTAPAHCARHPNLLPSRNDVPTLDYRVHTRQRRLKVRAATERPICSYRRRVFVVREL